MELVLYSEDDLPVGAVNSTNWAFRKLRRKICVNSEELPSKILRNLQEKIISSKLFRRVLILRGLWFSKQFFRLFMSKIRRRHCNFI